MAQTAEIKVLVSSDSTELQKTNDELEATGAIAGDVNKKFKDLEATNKNVEKGFQSLKTRVREAKEDLQRAEERFGPFSKEANEARKRAGELADQLGDLNRQVNLLNPEDKIKAFTNLSQGVVGAFSIATGAVQAFGAENEEVQRIAQKLQGALNLVQGVQSIIGLKEAYQDVKVVLGLTTAAQAALTTATVAGTAATEGATLATRAFSVALTATGIGAIVVALGALVGAWISVEQSITDAEEANKRYARAEKDRQSAQTLFFETFDKALNKQISQLQFQIDLRKVQGATEQELLRLEIEKEKAINRALNAAIASGKTQIADEEKLLETREKSNQRRQILEVQLTRKIQEEQNKRLQNAQRSAEDADKIIPLPSPQVVENKVDEIFEVIGTSIEKNSTDLPEIPFFTERELKERSDAIRNTTDEAAQFFSDSYSFISDLARQANQEQIDDLERQKEKGIITEEQYQARLKELKIQQAKQDKEAAIFSATIQLAQALVNALTFQPATAVPAALVLASVVAAANLAKIIATPLPKFKEGTLNVGGGNLDADGGMHAIVHRGEAIIPADRNRSYHPTLEAIYNKQISPAEINSYVLNRLAGKSGIGRDTVVASVDTYGLSRALSKNKSVQIENAQTVGKAIASELARGYNRRQVV